MLAPKDIAELIQLRLDRDLSYGALAEQIGIGQSKLYAVLNTPPAKLRMNDRTEHKLRRFLEKQREIAAAQGASS